MTPFRAKLITVIMTGFIPAFAAIVGGLIAIDLVEVALWLGATIVGGSLFTLVLWRLSARPRLFWYHTFYTHWQLWIAVIAVIILLALVYVGVKSSQPMISLAWDTVVTLASLLTSAIVISSRLSSLWPLLTPSRVDESQLRTTLHYLGKIGDAVGRDDPYSDGFADAVFELEMLPSVSSLGKAKTIVCIFLQRCNARWSPTLQQWVAITSRRFLWPLGVCTVSGLRLNASDSPLALVVDEGCVLRLFASDWADKGSTWFAPTQRYRVTVYFSDRTWTEATTII